MNQDDYKSITFNSNDFTNFITFTKVMTAKDKSNYSKIISLHVEGDYLVGRVLGDNNRYIEYYIQIYNKDSLNVLSDYICVSINDMATLIKCSTSDKFVIRKCFNQYEFSVIGEGWLPFNTVDIDTNLYNLPPDTEEIGTINSSKLNGAISSVIGYMQDSPHMVDKYIVFKNTKMFVTSRLSGVVIRDEFLDLTISREDAARLKFLLKSDFNLTIARSESDIERTIFLGHNFKFVIPSSSVTKSEVSYVEDIDGFITVKCDDLYRLVVFATEYSASSQSIGLTIKDGKLLVSVKNRLAANHNSIINSNPIGNVVNTKEVRISPQHLLKALKLFQDRHAESVNIYFNDDLLNQDRIIMFNNNTQAIINIQ